MPAEVIIGLPLAVCFLWLAAMIVRALWRRHQRRIAAVNEILHEARHYVSSRPPTRHTVNFNETVAKVVVSKVVTFPKRDGGKGPDAA